MPYKTTKMPNLQHISNIKMLQMLSGNDEAIANVYISQNLAVVRTIPLSSVTNFLQGTPLISDEMRVLILKKGDIDVNINLVKHHIEANDMVFLGFNGIMELERFSEDVQALGLALSDDLFSMAVGNQTPSSLDGHLRSFHIHLTHEEFNFIDHLHLILSDNIKQVEHSAQVTLRLISSLLWQIDYLHGKHEQQESLNQSREQQVFASFIQLVSQYAPQHHDIDFYADKLCLSPRYMGNLIKTASGKTAKQWIDDSIVTRIKIELQHSDKQIQQIADEMNFGNTSFFTKFFRRMTGNTPNEFRKKKH